MNPIGNNLNNINPRPNSTNGIEQFQKLMLEARAIKAKTQQTNANLSENISAQVNTAPNQNFKLPTQTQIETPPDTSRGIRKGMVIDIKV